MVLETVVANVLNKVLGDYVGNLETSQLSIGIWKGMFLIVAFLSSFQGMARAFILAIITAINVAYPLTRIQPTSISLTFIPIHSTLCLASSFCHAGDVTLQNLRLKTSALDKFNLPLQVLEGYLGDLTLTIPWNDLKNKPVRVVVNNVYVLATPRAESEYDPEEEEERAQKVKMERLETVEMIAAQAKGVKPENKDQNASFVTQLVTKIVDNLQVSIKNIHIRYEDRVSHPKNPFSLGITLDELSAVSTDENWNQTFIHEQVGVIHKLLKLGSLAVYWNTDAISLASKGSHADWVASFTRLIATNTSIPSDNQYILQPVSGVGKLRLSKTYKPNQPRYFGLLEFDHLGFELDDRQYASLFALLGAFDMYVRSQQYRKFRPPKSITPKMDPLAWFKYAGTCILHDIHERNRKWTWAFFAERRDDRKEYVRIWKAVKMTKATPEDQTSLKALERKLTYEDIRFYRSIAKNQLRKEKAYAAITKAEQERKAKEAAAAAAASSSAPGTTTTGWVSSLWSYAVGTSTATSPTSSTTGLAQGQESGASGGGVLTLDQMKQLYDTIEFNPDEVLRDADIPPDAIFMKLQWRLNTGSFAIRRKPVPQPYALQPSGPSLLDAIKSPGAPSMVRGGSSGGIGLGSALSPTVFSASPSHREQQQQAPPLMSVVFEGFAAEIVQRPQPRGGAKVPAATVTGEVTMIGGGGESSVSASGGGGSLAAGSGGVGKGGNNVGSTDKITAVVTLGGMTVYDGTTKGTLYPNMVQAKRVAKKGTTVTRTDEGEDISLTQEAASSDIPPSPTTPSPETSGKAPNFFTMRVEHNPLNDQSDNSVWIRMLPLEVVYNPVAINEIVGFFTPPREEYETLSTLKAVAQNTFQGLRSQTRAGLEYAIEEHKTLDLKIDVDAPIFVFPESVTDRNSTVILVDAGHLLVVSDLLNKEVLRATQQKMLESGTDPTDVRDLTAFLYDRFTLSLSAVQVLVGQNVEHCLNCVYQIKDAQHEKEGASIEPITEDGSKQGAVVTGTSPTAVSSAASVTGIHDLHLIERVDMSFCLELSILPKMVDITKTKISGKLPRLHVNFSDRKYKAVMKMLDLISGPAVGGAGASNPDSAGAAGGQARTAAGAAPAPRKLSMSKEEKTSSTGQHVRKKKSEGALSVSGGAAGSTSAGLDWMPSAFPPAPTWDPNDLVVGESDTESFYDAEEGESDVEEGGEGPQAGAELHKRPRTPAKMQGERDAMAEAAAAAASRPDRVLMEFLFDVGEVSVSLKKSDPKAAANNGNGGNNVIVAIPERVLAEAKVEGFSLKYRQRPHDMFVDIGIGRAQIEDQMQQDDVRFKYVLAPSSSASPVTAAVVSQEASGLVPQQLISIEYRSYKSTSPDYKGVDQSVAISFAAVDIVITRDSVLYLYDFILSTFTTTSTGLTPSAGGAEGALPQSVPPLDSPEAKTVVKAIADGGETIDDTRTGVAGGDDTDVEGGEDKEDQEGISAVAPAAARTMVVVAKMQSINFVVNRNGAMLASGSFAAGEMEIKMMPNSMVVNGHLGDLSVRDELDRPWLTAAVAAKHSVSIGGKATVSPTAIAAATRLTAANEMFREFLRIEGDEVANFRFETFSQNSDKYPGYDSALTLRTSSVRITYLEDLIRELRDYFGEFQRMNVLLERARRAAAGAATQIQENAGKFHFDLQLETPIIEFPNFASLSAAAAGGAWEGEVSSFTTFLGRINAQNEFSVAQNGLPCNIIRADIQSIKLVSSAFAWLSTEAVSGDASTSSSLGPADMFPTVPYQILQDVNLQMVMVSVQPSDTALVSLVPDTQLHVNVSEVEVKFRQNQYVFLLKLLDSISKINSSAADPGTAAPQSASSAPKAITAKETLEDNRASMEVSVYMPTVAFELETDQTETDTENKVEEHSKKHASMQVELGADDVSSVSSSISISTTPRSPPSRRPMQYKPLARFSLQSATVNVAMRKNGIMETELIVFALKMLDTRPGTQTIFKDLTPAAASIKRKGHHHHHREKNADGGADQQQLLSIRWTRSAEGTSDYNITFDSPRLILVIDHLFAIRDFFVSSGPAQPNVTSNAEKNSGAHAAAADPVHGNAPVANLTSYRLTFVDVEFILLQNAQILDTEAIVLTAKQLILVLSKHQAISVRDLGMFFCNMNHRAETTVRFIENFDLEYQMTTQQTKSGGGGRGQHAPPPQFKSTQALAVSPLTVRISYRDVLVIMDIVNTVSALSAKVNGGAGAPTESTTTSPEEEQLFALEGHRHTHDVVVSTEALELRSQGIRLILIDDLNDLHLPMFEVAIMPLTIDVSDWSRALRVNTSISLQINYFNIKNSHWEPLLEPWQCILNVFRQAENGAMTIDFFSKKKLEVNVTHVFIETLLNTFTLWSKQEARTLLARKGDHSPYLLRNETGYDMHVWAESIGDGLDTELKKLGNGQEIPWRFDDWRVMRENTSSVPNKLSVQLSGASWESLKGIPVDREGRSVYMLRPMVDHVTHRLVCEVTLRNKIKVVTFRSAMVVANETRHTVEVIVVNAQGHRTAGPFSVEPTKECSVPIERCYHDYIVVRPQGFGFQWSNPLPFWRDMQKEKAIPLVSCRADPQTSPFLFQIKTVVPPEAQGSSYPILTYKLLPPFQLENLLPYDFQYVMKSGQQEYRNYLKAGGIDTIHTINPSQIISLGIVLPGTDYKPSEVAILVNTEMDYRDEYIKLVDSQNKPLELRIKYHDKLANVGRKVSIYTPYVIFNKTGLDMYFSEKSLMSTPRLAAGQRTTRAKKDGEVPPFMFSYSSFNSIQNRMQLKVADSEWSKPLSFEAVGSSYEVQVPASNKGAVVHLGCQVKEGEGKYYLTKVVTLTPRYIIVNQMNDDVHCRQGGTTILVKAKETRPLHYLKATREGELQLSVRLTGLINEWSSPFDMNQIGRIFVKLRRMGNEEEDLIRTEVILEGATIFLMLNKEEGPWPFRIDNTCDVDVHSKERYLVRRHYSRSYAWDNPSELKKALVLNVNGQSREVDVLEIGQLVPFRYPVAGTNKFEIMAIQVFAEGPTLVIRLSPYVESDSMFRRGSIQSLQSISSSQSGGQQVEIGKDEFEVVGSKFLTVYLKCRSLILTFLLFLLLVELKKREDAKLLTTINVRLEGIGISVMNRQMQELLYASIKDLVIEYTDTSTIENLEFRIKWLQIDNQLYGGLEPIFVYPTVIPKGIQKNGEEAPVLWLELCKSKDKSYGVDYYYFFMILLQELSFDLDEDFLLALLDFSQFKVDGWEMKEEEMWDRSTTIPTPTLQEGDVRMYFERLLLQPVQVNISFARTQSVNGDETRQQSRNILTFLFDVFTMTIGNVHDAPLRLNALELHHPIVTFSQLADLVIKFYTQEMVGQMHKVIGSADFLGNPVGLFSNVSSGVRDFFYEPVQGFEITRPQESVIGLVKGTTSLFKKTVYGVTDTFSKMTGSVSKGLSVITLDEESKPIEGAEKEGVSGFVKGLGKGLVGVVTKPVVGAFDLVSNVTEGIRNTTTVFDVDLDRQRLPRHIGKEGILKPYDPREALGLSWLKGVENGRYFHEEYVAHLDLRIEDLVAMVTSARVLMLRIKRLKVDWEIPHDDLQAVRVEGGGITLLRKGTRQAKARIIPCPDVSSAQWLCNKIDQEFAEYQTRLRPLD
ncbi:hypothetical protein HK102_000456 [Quaeritorhiza haematococci]|nr:hypothetical protein HK102_000456 [Quaeritorhiza haematococci]